MPESTEPALEQAVEMEHLDDGVILARHDRQTESASIDVSSLDGGLQPDKLIGKTIADKYLIESYLGGGGMSHVYKARHLHIKHKVVALKLLQSQVFVDPQHVLRLQQEANAAGSLSHRNIIEIQDFGLAGPTQPYLVMDYFEGQSLDQVIKAEGRIDLQRLVGIIGQVCSALAHAHENGVIHRDVKPSNIMVMQDEHGKDLVKVVDFGIAKQSAGEAEISKLTQTGDILGSPLYMSPEQCLGQTVDGRTDIYSLGCVVYEAITGVSPFVGDTTFETIYKHLNEAPPPFPAAVRRNPQAKALEAIVCKMLAKRPDERYRFMLEVASDLKYLEHHIDSATGYLRLVWVLWKARRSARARKAVAIESGLTLSSVVAVVVALLLFVLPGMVKESAFEEASNQLIMGELKSSLHTLMADDSLVADIFGRRDAEAPRTFRNGIRLLSDFDRLGFLCKGRPEQRKALEALKATVIEGAAASLNFKAAVLKRIHKESGKSTGQRPNSAFAEMMTCWSETLASSNTLLSKSMVAWDHAQKERIWCETVFELSKWLGVIILIVIPSLLAARWRSRKGG